MSALTYSARVDAMLEEVPMRGTMLEYRERQLRRLLINAVERDTERDELVAALRTVAPLVDNHVNGDDADEMCAWAEALESINAALAKVSA